MNFFSHSSRVINALLVIGAIVFVLSILLSGSLFWKFSRILLAPSSIERGTLGQEGIACGGPERLPCVPGFVCDADDDEVYGECVVDVRETLPAGTEGMVCGGDRGCQPGLVCNAIGGAAGVCVRPEQR